MQQGVANRWVRYRLVCRKSRGGTFYCFDKSTGKRTSLDTTDEDEAAQIVAAKNQAIRQPALNLQIARAYLSGTDSGVNTRTWQNALYTLVASKHGPNLERWQRAIHDKAIDLIRNRPIVETKGEMLFKVLQTGTVSTTVFLRQLHNFCVDMNWLPWPLIRYKEKRRSLNESEITFLLTLGTNTLHTSTAHFSAQSGQGL